MNCDKSILNGAVFTKLLDAKSQGDYLRMIQEITKDHFDMKNASKFGITKQKIIDFCTQLTSQNALKSSQHRLFVENFAEILVYKFDSKVVTLQKKIKNVLANIIYLLNMHPGQLFYFYPEISQDPFLRKHLENCLIRFK